MFNTIVITFDERIIEIRKLIKLNGKLPTGCEKDKTVKSHGMFLTTCRKNYKKNKLSPEHISALESLDGFVWSTYKKIKNELFLR